MAENESREFGMSDGHMRETRRFMFGVVLPAGVICGVIISLYVSDFAVGRSLISAGVVAAMMTVIFAIEVPLLNRMLRNQRLAVFEKGLEMNWGSKRMEIQWGQIKEVKVVRGPKLEVLRIQIVTQEEKKLMLWGLSGMEELAEVFEKTGGADWQVHTERQRLKAHSPWYFILPMVVVMGLFIAAMEHGPEALAMLGAVLYFWVAGFLLVVRPLTACNPRLKWFEIAACILLLIGGIRAVWVLLTG